ncbi:hypothetical protein D3C85_1702970 [compost metagenome]
MTGLSLARLGQYGKEVVAGDLLRNLGRQGIKERIEAMQLLAQAVETPDHVGTKHEALREALDQR